MGERFTAEVDVASAAIASLTTNCVILARLSQKGIFTPDEVDRMISEGLNLLGEPGRATVVDAVQKILPGVKIERITP